MRKNELIAQSIPDEIDQDELYDFDPAGEAKAEEALLNAQASRLRHFNDVTLPELEKSLNKLKSSLNALQMLQSLKGKINV